MADAALCSAIEDMIRLCRREGLDATSEYNHLWMAYAAVRGRDEIEMRRNLPGELEDGA